MLRPEISKADEKDLPQIHCLQRLAFYENGIRYKDPNMPPLPQTLDEFIEEARYNTILKAVIDGRIIGSVRGSQTEDSCHISRVIVHPDYQNQGVGHLLIYAIEREFNVSVFELVTGHLDEKNISFYKKLGYVVHEGQIDKVTDTLNFIHMSKRVKADL